MRYFTFDNRFYEDYKTDLEWLYTLLWAAPITLKRITSDLGLLPQ